MKCSASVNVSHKVSGQGFGYGTQECDLEEGHAGFHRLGQVSWADARSRLEPVPASPARPTDRNMSNKDKIRKWMANNGEDEPFDELLSQPSPAQISDEQAEYHTECRYPDCQCKRVADPKADFGFKLICEAPPLPPGRDPVHPLLTGDVTCSECSHNIHQSVDGTWVAVDGFSCGTADDGKHVPKYRAGQPKGGHWTNPCGYCGSPAGSPCVNHAGTKPIKHVHLKRLEPVEAVSTAPKVTHAFVDSGITAGNTGIPLCDECGGSERLYVHKQSTPLPQQGCEHDLDPTFCGYCIDDRTASPRDGIDLIKEERLRQIESEHWTPAHDDKHTTFELTRAAVSYAFSVVNIYSVANWWPWDWSWYKPSDDPIRNLVKAGALIAAEIDRIQRSQK